ncbi:DNA invertase Pin-like site-specific DNA recombinase [Clostridium moniliforme]|uniref:DNA invertase Pin-like site-specific DNA recombinase n=1 Tax=Clostridium moniliforme TaxID=39489 RepID=A0ABS4F0P4_9CLOT|nr:recombinase family protein [Clostridium moniliforme]MBP1889828.1 DNA invertase Pin-like site-specific DNA recombinase [Clostridium moniliforme]
MKKIAIYSRKSKETDTGESIKNQINLCKNYFSNKYSNCNFEIFVDEGFSGGNTNRPAFQNMMKFSRLKKFDIIGIYKIDRIARNITDFFNIYNELEKNNIKLVSITEGFDATTPIGRMMMTILAGFADMERENIRERIKDNMNELAKLGRWSGGTPPSGYISESKYINGKKITYLKLLENKKEIIEKIFKLASDNFTTYQIGKKLNISSKTISNIIANPTYIKSDLEAKHYLENIGYKVYGDINGKGFLSYGRRPKRNGKKLYNSPDKFVSVSVHEGIVDSLTWIKANENLKKRALIGRPRISNNSFLAHLVTCKCGSKMFLTYSYTKKNGDKSFYFKCSGKKNKSINCNSSSIRASVLEEKVLDVLIKISLNKNLLNKYINVNNNNYKKELANLKNKLKSNKSKIDSLTNKISILNGDALKIINNKINNICDENRTIDKNIMNLEKNLMLNKNQNYSLDYFQTKLKYILIILNELPITEKQNFVKEVIKEIKFDGNNSVQIIFNDII